MHIANRIIFNLNFHQYNRVIKWPLFFSLLEICLFVIVIFFFMKSVCLIVS